MSQICEPRPEDPRCIERFAYCDIPANLCNNPQNPLVSYCANLPPPPFGDPPPREGLFRNPGDVQTKICTEQRRMCSCSGETIVNDHRCALRIPAAGVNVSPSGLELVATHPSPVEGQRERWEVILSDLDHLVEAATQGSNSPTVLSLCNSLDANGNDDIRRSYVSAGLIPRVVVVGSPP